MEVSSNQKGTKIQDGNGVAEVMSAILRNEEEIDRDKEHFWVIGLSTKNSIKFIDLVGLGTLTSALIHPRETYRRAINRGVASIICVHNHPSGDLEPSREDIKVSEQLKNAGDIVGIHVLDHVIINVDGEFTSMKQRGYL